MRTNQLLTLNRSSTISQDAIVAISLPIRRNSRNNQSPYQPQKSDRCSRIKSPINSAVKSITKEEFLTPSKTFVAHHKKCKRSTESVVSPQSIVKLYTSNPFKVKHSCKKQKELFSHSQCQSILSSSNLRKHQGQRFSEIAPSYVSQFKLTSD